MPPGQRPYYLFLYWNRTGILTSRPLRVMVFERALWGAAEGAIGEAVGAEVPSGALMGVSAGMTAGVSLGMVMVGGGTAV